MSNKIINPVNNQSYSIFSSNGKKLLKQYVTQFNGGSTPTTMTTTMTKNDGKPLEKHKPTMNKEPALSLSLRALLNTPEDEDNLKALLEMTPEDEDNLKEVLTKSTQFGHPPIHHPIPPRTVSVHPQHPLLSPPVLQLSLIHI